MMLLLSILSVVNVGLCLKFPDEFLFGVSTSAYQVEGAWNESGKGENIWDHWVHETPSVIEDRSNGDITSNSYHRTESDIQLLKDLGAQFYRFSISWSRIYPDGHSVINQEGVDYYNKLIDLLIANNIIPFVTIYHWDLPQPLQSVLGGWVNPKVGHYYAEYAETLFKLYGDRVKYWITFNEPRYLCDGYSNGKWAPGLKFQGIGNYLCMEVVLRAHGRVYRLYESKYKNKQNGMIGITIGFNWYEPFTNSSVDLEATKRMRDFDIGIIFHPIFSKTGDYPAVVRQRVDQRSQELNFPRSRLPLLSLDDIKMIKGSYDFLGLNHYCSTLIRHRSSNDPRHPEPSLDDDINVGLEYHPSWNGFEARPSMKANPIGFYKVLKWVKQEYGDFPIFITENGYADLGAIQDTKRVKYLQEYLIQLCKAIADGVNVRGYSSWSLLDNFEWTSGYKHKYGLYYVNMTDPNRRRIPKLSSKVYADIIRKRGTDFQFCDKNDCNTNKYF